MGKKLFKYYEKIVWISTIDDNSKPTCVCHLLKYLITMVTVNACV